MGRRSTATKLPWWRSTGNVTARVRQGLPNHDPEWLRFRAGFVTGTLRELRLRMKARHPEAPVTIAVIAQDLAVPHGTAIWAPSRISAPGSTRR